MIETDYGQFDLGWDVPFGFDGNFDRFFAGQLNGLVGAADSNGVYLNLARRSGTPQSLHQTRNGTPPRQRRLQA